MTPEEEAEVTRLLAAAAEPEPVPDEVAARLDAVLAGLVEERSAPGGQAGPGSPVPGAPGDQLAAARARRRRWPAALLGAAAVMVGGYAVAGLVGDGSLTGAGGDGASAGGDSSLARDQAQSDGGGADGSGAEGQPEAAPGRPTMPGRVMMAVRLRSDRLETDVRRALAGTGPTALWGEVTEPVPTHGSMTGEEAAPDPAPDPAAGRDLRGCAPPPLARDQSWQPARYDGEQAVLVLDGARAGVVAATVYSCAGSVLDRTEVPAAR
jgi:hypothetical protein